MTQFEITPKRSILITGIVGVCLFLFATPFIVLPIIKQFGVDSVKLRIILSISSSWICLALIYLYTHKVEKLNFLIWDEVNYPINYFLRLVVLTLLIQYAGSIIIGIVLKLSGYNMSNDKILELLNVIKSNKLMIFVIAATAAITEELIFRGYLLTRLQLLIKDPYHSIIISSILFGIAHLGYGTMKQLIGTFFIGLVMAIHYNRYRNIKIIIVCHFIWDYVLLIILLHAK